MTLVSQRSRKVEEDQAALIGRARAGDVDAFEAVYRSHCEQVSVVCSWMTTDATEAEELAQDAWVRAWKRLETFRGKADFSTWMHRLTINLFLDRKRRDARWRRRIVSMEDERSGLARTMDRRASMPGSRLDLERAVNTLPDGARTVFLLHEVEGYKQREIAERMGIAVGTVKAQLHRARKLLRTALER